MAMAQDEKELIHKLVLTGHLNVPERRQLPDRKAKLSLIVTVLEEALQSKEWFTAWWLPDDSMIGCQITYRGDGPTRLCWHYSGIEGERDAVRDFESYRQAAEAIIQEARPFWSNNLDGILIDWAA
jgi:hypothetical protein